MEIVNEMKLDVTIIDKHVANDGTLPMGAVDQADLEAKLKAALGADDLHLTEIKQFPRDEA